MDALAQRILDALPNPVCTLSLDGRITGVNRAWSRAAATRRAARRGVLRAAAPGEEIWTAMGHEEERGPMEQAMMALAAGRSDLVSWEVSRHAPDGEHVALLQLAPLREDHAVTGFVCTTVDITASHHSRGLLIELGTALARDIDVERVLRTSAHELQRAVPHDALVIALAAAGAADRDAGTLRVEHSTGYAEDSGALEERLRPAWQEAISTGCVLQSRNAAGIELTVALAHAEGAIGTMTLLVREMPPGRLRESARMLEVVGSQMAAALERASLVHRASERCRREASAGTAVGIATELRNPLFGISSAAQLLRFRATEDPVIERNVGRILREVERLNAAVTTLLEYGRPHPLDLRPGDPDAVWDDVLQHNRGALEKRALSLERTRAAPPARCAIDAAWLARAFKALLVSAADRAPEGSALALVTRVGTEGAWQGSLLHGGEPIPREVLASIFELVAPLRPGGALAELALCRRIVEEHGGTIGVQSVPEQGTTISLILPAASGTVRGEEP